jgi:hypothetical protein
LIVENVKRRLKKGKRHDQETWTINGC